MSAGDGSSKIDDAIKKLTDALSNVGTKNDADISNLTFQLEALMLVKTLKNKENCEEVQSAENVTDEERLLHVKKTNGSSESTKNHMTQAKILSIQEKLIENITQRTENKVVTLPLIKKFNKTPTPNEKNVYSNYIKGNFGEIATDIFMARSIPENATGKERGAFEKIDEEKAITPEENVIRTIGECLCIHEPRIINMATKPDTGIDGIYVDKKSNKIYIVDAKYGSSVLGQADDVFEKNRVVFRAVEAEKREAFYAEQEALKEKDRKKAEAKVNKLSESLKDAKSEKEKEEIQANLDNAIALRDRRVNVSLYKQLSPLWIFDRLGSATNQKCAELIASKMIDGEKDTIFSFVSKVILAEYRHKDGVKVNNIAEQDSKTKDILLVYGKSRGQYTNKIYKPGEIYIDEFNDVGASLSYEQ